jgi:Copine
MVRSQVAVRVIDTCLRRRAPLCAHCALDNATFRTCSVAEGSVIVQAGSHLLCAVRLCQCHGTGATRHCAQLLRCHAGFGDLNSKDHSLISFSPDGQPIHTLENVLAAYQGIIDSLHLSGPTSFAPAIYKAIEIVRESRAQYHILVIIADGQVCTKQTFETDVRNADGQWT